MRKRILTILLIALLIMGSAAVAAGESVRLLACSVGKADAILLEAGGAVCLIDTGYAYSRGRILAGLRTLGAERLDAVIITHTDSDHIGGLDWLVESDIEIGGWYASACFSGKKKKHPASKAAAVRDREVTFVQAGDTIPLGTTELKVLAPISKSDNENDNSLVLRLDTDNGAILLTGDMELDEEAELLKSGADVSCRILKVANHADDDTGSEAFIRAASPELAVISTDSMEKPDTPDPTLVGLLRAVGAQVPDTQNCTLGILAELGEAVQWRYLDSPMPTTELMISRVDAENDMVTLRNSSEKDIDLSDWYLYSDRGSELYVFPEGSVIEAGTTLRIGTASTPSTETADLYRSGKKLIHPSKPDMICLMDSYGSIVDSLQS